MVRLGTSFRNLQCLRTKANPFFCFIKAHHAITGPCHDLRNYNTAIKERIRRAEPNSVGATIAENEGIPNKIRIPAAVSHTVRCQAGSMRSTHIFHY